MKTFHGPTSPHLCQWSHYRKMLVTVLVSFHCTNAYQRLYELTASSKQRIPQCWYKVTSCCWRVCSSCRIYVVNWQTILLLHMAWRGSGWCGYNHRGGKNVAATLEFVLFPVFINWKPAGGRIIALKALGAEECRESSNVLLCVLLLQCY